MLRNSALIWLAEGPAAKEEHRSDDPEWRERPQHGFGMIAPRKLDAVELTGLEAVRLLRGNVGWRTLASFGLQSSTNFHQREAEKVEPAPSLRLACPHVVCRQADAPDFVHRTCFYEHSVPSANEPCFEF